MPADAELLSCTNLSADESLLTGESVSVRKACSDGKASMARPGGDDLPFVYSGSLVVQGHGAAVVKATGLHTEIGKIGRALQKVKSDETALQKETNSPCSQLGPPRAGPMHACSDSIRPDQRQLD